MKKRRLGVQVTISKHVTRCIDCPYYQSTMDGMTCIKAEEEGPYKGLIIDNQFIISPRCPLR